MSSSMSFNTARDILGAGDPERLTALNRILGVAALVSGPAGSLLPGALSIVGSAWGWIDQKSELMQHLGALLDAGRQRAAHTTGYDRHQLLAAAHTALVTGALFSALEKEIGPAYRQLDFREDEKLKLLQRDTTAPASDVVAHLLRMQIPVPWAGCGFEESTATVIAPMLQNAATRCIQFFEGLALWPAVLRRMPGPSPFPTAPPGWSSDFSMSGGLIKRVTDRAVSKYRDDYRRLAADVPEFGIWAMLGQLSAVTAQAEAHARARAQAERHSLALLERLLSPVGRVQPEKLGKNRDVIHKRNRAELTRPLAPISELSAGSELRVPTVHDGYLDPRFRWVLHGDGARLSDDAWWAEQKCSDDIGGFLAAYFSSARSTELPLVILGHPGAGKSLLTKILAARLPAHEFVTVRVPLRRIDKKSSLVFEQVDSFLIHDTHHGVSWRDLSEESRDAVRVVFLDGLDELMQATGTTESDYLMDVVRFQQKERELFLPVAAVVTSRTVVADVAQVPKGTLVIKLEDFDDAQITEWVRTWNDTNRRNGAPDALSAEAVRDLGDLARQPLLLLMSALFGASADLYAGGGQWTQAQLYQLLLNGFVARELAKPGQKAAPHQRGRADNGAAQRELWQLGVTAFAMFNRGQQSVRRKPLNGDLASLLPTPGPGTRDNDADFLDDALRTISRFFFVHAAEFEGSSVVDGNYEFLHATFGEFLIAYHVLHQIELLSRARQASVDGQQRDDDRLFALVSHQQLAVGGAILPFVKQLFDQRKLSGQAAVAEELAALLIECQVREGVGRFKNYNPSGRTLTARIAEYTANLLMLLTEIKTTTAVSEIAGRANPQEWWRSTMRLLRFGLDDTGWTAIVSGIETLSEPELSFRRRETAADPTLFSVHEARLIGAPEQELFALLGTTAYHGRRVDDWPDAAMSDCMRITASLVHRDDRPGDLDAALRLSQRADHGPISGLVGEYLVRHAHHLEPAVLQKVVERLIKADPAGSVIRLAPVVAQFPALLESLPRLMTSYAVRFTDARDAAEVLAATRVALKMWRGQGTHLLRELDREIVLNFEGHTAGWASAEAFDDISEEAVVRAAIPDLASLYANRYQPRGPVGPPANEMTGGRHQLPRRSPSEEDGSVDVDATTVRPHSP